MGGIIGLRCLVIYTKTETKEDAESVTGGVPTLERGNVKYHAINHSSHAPAWEFIRKRFSVSILEQETE